MLGSIEKLKKLELLSEQFLKRLEKNGQDIDPNANQMIVKIDTPFGPRDVQTYLRKFDWDLVRFPKGKSLNIMIS